MTCRLALTLAVFFAGAGSIRAQQPDDRPEKPKKPKDRSCLRSDGSLDIRRTTECLTNELSLDVGQSASLKSALDGYKKKSAEIKRQYRPPDEVLSRLNSIREEMAAARQAKDEAAIKTLVDELHTIREGEDRRREPMVQSFAVMHNELMGTIKATLRPDQAARLDTLWTERIVAPRETRAAFRGKKRSAQALKAMVERLPGLSRDQEDRLELQFRAHMDAVRAVGTDEAARDRLVDRLYDDVMLLLNPEQQERIEKEMQGGRSGDVETPTDSDDEKPGSPPNP